MLAFAAPSAAPAQGPMIMQLDPMITNCFDVSPSDLMRDVSSSSLESAQTSTDESVTYKLRDVKTFPQMKPKRDKRLCLPRSNSWSYSF